ncbi:hypothetical protein [Streptomyces sp. NBC_01725]|uniref:hypothetical protein n=1 Tax=Streptomyces sp. NBC_01725 TaxID=2975923 RepID=UPI003FCCAC64
MDALGAELDGYHAFHAVRADLLGRLGRRREAAQAYAAAAARTENAAERDFLRRHESECRPGPARPRRALDFENTPIRTVAS